MPSLKALSGTKATQEFAQRIAEQVKKQRDQSVDVNGGIKTTKALAAHIEKGREVSFDYDRLIDESRSYS